MKFRCWAKLHCSACSRVPCADFKIRATRACLALNITSLDPVSRHALLGLDSHCHTGDIYCIRPYQGQPLYFFSWPVLPRPLLVDTPPRRVGDVDQGQRQRTSNKEAVCSQNWWKLTLISFCTVAYFYQHKQNFSLKVQLFLFSFQLFLFCI